MTELEVAKSAIDRVLQAHLPYPAFAVDRHWNLILSNSALPQLYEGCSAELMRPPVNSVRLLLHPSGMGTRIVNFAAWRGHTLHVLRQQLEPRADPVIQGLLSGVAGYPVPPGSEAPDNFDGSQRLANTTPDIDPLRHCVLPESVTVFGTASDVTLSELALEMLFPADSETVEIVRRITAEPNSL